MKRLRFSLAVLLLRDDGVFGFHIPSFWRRSDGLNPGRSTISDRLRSSHCAWSFQQMESFVVDKVFGTLDGDTSNTKSNNDATSSTSTPTSSSTLTSTTTKDDPNQVLFEVDRLVEANETITQQSLESLNHYLRRWGQLLESPEKAMSDGIITPVTCSGVRQVNQTLICDSTVQAEGIKLKFCPPKRYLSYSEQKDMEKGKLPDRKGGKVDAWSPGGVELIMLRKRQNVSASLVHGDDINTSHDGDHHYLQILARRCDVDGDTVIKLTSERQIIRRLKEAIRIWQKVRADL